MEDMRGVKRECSPFAEGSPAANDAKTPPLEPSGTPSPPGSPLEVSSHRPFSPVFEQGGPSGKAPVIDLSSSSDEEDSFANTSRDFEFAHRLYGELNRDLLGPPGDGKIIIHNNSDKEKEEAREEKSTGAEDATASAAVNPISTASADDTVTLAEKSSTPSASPANVDDDPGVVPMIVVTVWPWVRRWRRAAAMEMKPTHLRLPRQERRLRQACFKESYVRWCYPSFFFVQRSWDGDAESLITLMPFMPVNNFCSLLYFGYVLDVVLDSK
jgi:hypothetical protein